MVSSRFFHTYDYFSGHLCYFKSALLLLDLCNSTNSLPDLLEAPSRSSVPDIQGFARCSDKVGLAALDRHASLHISKLFAAMSTSFKVPSVLDLTRYGVSIGLLGRGRMVFSAALNIRKSAINYTTPLI